MDSFAGQSTGGKGVATPNSYLTKPAGYTGMVCRQEPAWVQPTAGSQETVAHIRTSCLSTIPPSTDMLPARVAPAPSGSREVSHL